MWMGASRVTRHGALPALRKLYHYYLIFVKMKTTGNRQKPLNSKGAAIFKKMLDDKNAIHEYLSKGGKLTDLKDKYPFLDPLSIYDASRKN